MAEAAINPHAKQPTSLIAMIRSLWKNRALILQMTKREVMGRYKGSSMGLAWSFFNPLFMLVIYTFVFSEIFKSKWHGVGTNENKAQFAIILFTGMIVLNLITEVLSRAPALIVININYVKKVIFPIEILPVVVLGAALFHSLVSLFVLFIAFVIFYGFLNWTIIFLPLILIPFIILSIGLAWFLSSLGVFLRDVSQSIGIAMTMMMFLSPVFYPIAAVPEKLRPFLLINPPTFIIEQAREVIVWGHVPDWLGLGIYFLIAVALAWAGFAWFQKTRKGFADVL